MVAVGFATFVKDLLLSFEARSPEAGAGNVPSLELHICQVPVNALVPLVFALNSECIADPGRGEDFGDDLRRFC